MYFDNQQVFILNWYQVMLASDCSQYPALLFSGFTKLLVASGYASTQATRNVEIIDLEISSSSCHNLPNLPRRLAQGAGELLPDDSPVICGENHCYHYGNNEWQDFPSLSTAQRLMRAAKSPFLQEDFQLIVAGGDKSLGSHINTTEVLTNDGWNSDILPQLPVPIAGHCLLSLNSRTLMVIDTSNTFFMSDDLIWTTGPAMNVQRSSFSCGRVLKDEGSNELSVISAGGFFTDVVEVFDVDLNEWRFGPNLPYEIYSAEMVEDPLGGVILLGGIGAFGETNSKLLTPLFYLRIYLCCPPLFKFLTLVLLSIRRN